MSGTYTANVLGLCEFADCFLYGETCIGHDMYHKYIFRLQTRNNCRKKRFRGLKPGGPCHLSGGIGRDRRLSSFLRYCSFCYFDLFFYHFLFFLNYNDTTAARFALKTTAAFSEEPPKHGERYQNDNDRIYNFSRINFVC